MNILVPLVNGFEEIEALATVDILRRARFNVVIAGIPNTILIGDRGIKIIEQTGDFYGKTIAAGIVSLFSFQIIVNIGMAIGLLPMVGLTLPFISYGGSSLISSMIAIGILLNIGMRRPLF